MSPAIAFNKFILLFSLYIILSLVIYLTTSFTSPAWIVAFFVLLPFYGICLLSLLARATKNWKVKIKYRTFLLIPVSIFQLVKIISSPASCYGWHQGKSCYSLIQALLTTENIRTFARTPAPWQIVELAFPVTLVLYLLSIVALLRSIRVRDFPIDS
ncbi:hypothetical protein [Chamaesiphon polymorphus]|nr:hypothetical protein [Chamaesiphon polymorphus]